jgi:hypothetical protein
MFSRRTLLTVFSGLVSLVGGSPISVGPLAAPRTLTSNANAPDVQILRVDNFIPYGNADSLHAENVTAATVLPTGGFLALTWIRGVGGFAYKVSNAGSQVWRKELPSGSIANAAGVSTDGSYWIAGSLANIVNQKIGGDLVGFASRIEPDGTVSAPVVMSAKNTGRYFFCAVRSGAGFVQTDQTGARDEGLNLDNQRISLTNETGTILWERLLSADQGRRVVADTSPFANPNGQRSDCAGIFVGKNNRIFAAARVYVFPEFKTDKEKSEEITQNRGRHLRSATLLVALDSEGTMVASVRHDNTTAGFALASPTGPLLFETMQARTGRFDELASARQRLSLHTFDSDLKEQTPPVVFEDSNLDRVAAAYQTPEGGVLMIGCSGDDNTHPLYLRYVSVDGAYSPKRPASELGSTCGGVIRFSATTQPGEALVLFQGPQQGSRLLTLKYSH